MPGPVAGAGPHEPRETHSCSVVRVVAPLAGFCAASFLHMAFNATASLVSGPSLLWMYLGVALPLVIGMIVFVVRQVLREGRLIRERLVDYVRVGWLPDRKHLVTVTYDYKIGGASGQCTFSMRMP